MGMTIKEKHLKILEEYYRFHHEYDCGYGAMGTDEAAALKDAIDSMRRYQKIQEIMAKLNGNFYGSFLKNMQTLEKIYKVMEDEDDD